MKKTSIPFLLSYSLLGLVPTLHAADDTETPKYTDEQLQKLKAAEEKYKDNPKVLEIINNIKESSGITDTVEVEKEPGPPPITAHGEVITQGSHQQAEKAFRNKDNETAIAHYKVLAAEGDPEAGLKLGYIYEQEGDNKAAYAAYKQAAESEHSTIESKNAAERLKWLEKDVMSDDEIEQASQLNEDPSKPSMEQSESKGSSISTQVQYRPVNNTSTPVGTPPIKSAYYSQSSRPRIVKVSPKKISNFQHFKPEKFQRTPKS